MRKRSVICIGLLLMACAQRGPVPVVGVPGPRGPARIQQDVVATHAEQFDEDLAERPAGSQEEFAASAYLIAHLQQAGYVARLEPVPVADLVRSTDVIAVPPETAVPQVVVAIGYDTGSTPSEDGEALGVFLELARAALVAAPDSSVWFAALGAQHASGGEPFSGSKVLLRYLDDQDAEPLIVLLEPSELPLSLAGDPAALDAFRGEHEVGEPVDSEEIFGRSYDNVLIVRGRVASAGDDLLEFLREVDG